MSKIKSARENRIRNISRNRKIFEVGWVHGNEHIFTRHRRAQGGEGDAAAAGRAAEEAAVAERAAGRRRIGRRGGGADLCAAAACSGRDGGGRQDKAEEYIGSRTK